MGVGRDSLGAGLMAIRIVTDSTADLSPAVIADHRISVVPLTIEFGGASYRDRVDLPPDQFLKALPELSEPPKTAAPSPGAFREVYARLFSEGAEGIISIHLAGALSATVQSAQAAARMVDGPVAVVDGESASLGTGLLVWWAALRAQTGLALESLHEEVEALKSGLFALTAPLTLEYLARGGRIGQAARLVGTILDLKPLLLLERGSFRPERKVRGERQIAPAMLATLRQRVVLGSPILAALAYSERLEKHKDLIDAVRANYQVLGWLDGILGPVISAHVGPGAFGLIVLPLDESMAKRFGEVAG